MSAPRTWSRRLADIGLVVLFPAMLAAPPAWSLFGPAPATGNKERRAPAPPPPLNWNAEDLGQFPTRFEAYYKDTFGLRPTLIHWLDYAEVKWLKVSPSSQVVVGKKGWYFLNEATVTADCQASRLLTPLQLARWQQVLEARRDWLAQRGIRYLVVLVPEKQTIYPEDLPRPYRPMMAQTTRLEQLVAYLRAHTDVAIVDLREPLRRAKARERLYHYTDAHWNDRGGYVGYRQIVMILAAWFPGMEPWPRTDFEDQAKVEPGGDCARLIGLDEDLPEVYLNLVPRRPRHCQGTAEGFPPAPAWISPPFAMFQDNPRLPRALMFCDSFTFSMFPLLSEHFRRIAFVWQIFPTFDTAAVERERPDVVIQEMVERKLQYPEMVQQQRIPLIPPDSWAEPADNICRTARKWYQFLLGDG